MKKVIFRADFGFVGATRRREVEYPDDATPEEIEEDLVAWADELLDVWWEEES